MIDFEQVQKLRDRTGLSYEEAKKALEEADGDMLEAVLKLEKENRIQAPAGGGHFSSQDENKNRDEDGKDNTRDSRTSCSSTSSFGDQLTVFFKWCGKVIHKGNINSFEVNKDDNSIIILPVTALVLLLFFAFWIVIPLIIIGLFFGYRFRFRGPDLEKPEVNRAVESVSDVAARAVDSVVNAVDHISKDWNKDKGENNGADTDH